eukprot:TRINITY_DN3260_c0_g1_i1.p1 TRINITY_DN3260_c0_g1~~TRINITY_DN3260_c0_g1_i1.p1  ORF type:complete len:482 (+),score=117.30 TRINITY_DN3260_c0_g1_i1:25-1446(+)
MAEHLVDVVPPHLRFTAGSSSSSTRNVIIKNKSVSDLPLHIDPPGPPFCVKLGADRLGKEIRLTPGETLPLRLTLEASALQGQLICRFLVVRIELCRPLVVDVVAAPEGTPDDELRSFVQSQLTVAGFQAPANKAHSSREPASLEASSPDVHSPADAAAVLADFLGEAPAAAAMRKDVPAASRPLADDPQLDSDQTAMPAALAAFLGEAPAAAAIRKVGKINFEAQPRPAPMAASPPDTPESGDGRAIRRPDHQSCIDDMDDRPPTPTPDGFHDCDLDSRPRASEPVQTTENVQHHVTGRQSDAAIATAKAAARAAAARAQGILPDDQGMLPVAPASMTTMAQASAKPPAPAGYKAEDLFYLEGVGWCDIFGRAVGASRQDKTRQEADIQWARQEARQEASRQDKTSSSSSSSSADKTLKQAPVGKAPAAKATKQTPSAATTRPAAAGTSKLTAPAKMTAAQQRAAWDAIPGI